MIAASANSASSLIGHWNVVYEDGERYEIEFKNNGQVTVSFEYTGVPITYNGTNSSSTVSHVVSMIFPYTATNDTVLSI